MSCYGLGAWVGGPLSMCFLQLIPPGVATTGVGLVGSMMVAHSSPRAFALANQSSSLPSSVSARLRLNPFSQSSFLAIGWASLAAPQVQRLPKIIV